MTKPKDKNNAEIKNETKEEIKDGMEIRRNDEEPQFLIDLNPRGKIV